MTTARRVRCKPAAWAWAREPLAWLYLGLAFVGPLVVGLLLAFPAKAQVGGWGVLCTGAACDSVGALQVPSGATWQVEWTVPQNGECANPRVTSQRVYSADEVVWIFAPTCYDPQGAYVYCEDCTWRQREVFISAEPPASAASASPASEDAVREVSSMVQVIAGLVGVALFALGLSSHRVSV